MSAVLRFYFSSLSSNRVHLPKQKMNGTIPMVVPLYAEFRGVGGLPFTPTGTDVIARNTFKEHTVAVILTARTPFQTQVAIDIAVSIGECGYHKLIGLPIMDEAVFYGF